MMVDTHLAPVTNPRVLIVEDDADSARGLERLLMLVGHAVRVERDGLAALECAKQFAPHAVLIDLTLPTIDGCVVAERLRAHEVTRGSLLVAMTGWTDDAHVNRARAAGFDRHLVKPLTMDALLDALSAAHVASVPHSDLGTPIEAVE